MEVNISFFPAELNRQCIGSRSANAVRPEEIYASGFNSGEVNVTAASTRAKELVEVSNKRNSKYSDQVQGAICPKVISALSQ